MKKLLFESVFCRLAHLGRLCYARHITKTMLFHRLISAIFGLALALAALVAASYIEFDFKGASLPSAAAGILVPAVLMLSALYMAVRFLRFAATGKK